MVSALIAGFSAALILVAQSPLESESDTSGSPDRFAPESEIAFETVVRGESAPDGLAEQRRLDRLSPGFATVVDLGYESGARPNDALPEVIARGAGVSVRSLGGLGQFTSISIRGSSSQQVAIFVDGVPLGSSLGGLVDVSDLPLDLLDRVEVYRGFVPVAFGSAAIGGVINLVTREESEPRLFASTGAGSFGGRQAGLSFSERLGQRSRINAQLSVARADGAFDYYDNSAAPDFPERHTVRRRENNGFERVSGQVALNTRLGDWSLLVREVVLFKDQELPGAVGQEGRNAALDTATSQSIVTLSRKGVLGPGSRFELVGGFNVERRHLTDLEGAVGLDIDDEVSTILQSYVSPRFRVPLWPSAFFGGSAELRHESTGVDNRLRRTPDGSRTSGDASRQRTTAAAGFELEQFFAQGRAQVVPALRFDFLDSRFEAVPDGGLLNDLGRNNQSMYFSPRIAARFELISGLEARASVGRYLRPPSMQELFGDRGFVYGNEGLSPERGTSADFGLIAQLRRRGLTLYGQLTGFVSRSTDLIQFVQSGPVLRAQNLAGAAIHGAESSLSLDIHRGLARVQTNYTWMHTENQSEARNETGQPLPGRPTHEWFMRVSSHLGLDNGLVIPRPFYTFELVSGTYLDSSARAEIPTRLLHGAGIELQVYEWLNIAAEGRNLTNRIQTTWQTPSGTTRFVPQSDFINYPLPGRSVWLTASMNLDLGD